MLLEFIGPMINSGEKKIQKSRKKLHNLTYCGGGGGFAYSVYEKLHYLGDTIKFR